ncbi:NADP-dependent alcohol dehydrogenase [Orbus hercynius]|uniref:NADP-dependent alcohol dehydrogenase n=1 Tax=Orbus hercynius TaxID=593135 RepID=A0A495RJJ7_9GAMM|nr:iron-containing alcohol dehydrogenase [Orbus hercynius]RKS86958.1 NADP-dependent alcohol dehydrogenase [Orbus hercynius]
MQNFQFYNPTRIIFGQDTISQLATYLPKGARILIVYGGQSAINNGTLDEVKTTLAPDFYYQAFGGIEPNPHFETLLKAVDIVKKHKIDFLLAVGGGSVIDGTKFIAQAALYRDDPWKILTKTGVEVKDALPLATVLTLPATGSEMNCRGVITRAETQEKLSFRTELIFPQFSILDPSKTYSLPKRQLENGIVDSFVHTLEQYLTYPVDAKVTDYFAEGILKTLLEIAPDVIHKPDDYQARANFMWAATLALNGILATGVPEDWATHRIGHELTALYGLDHARTLALILPVLWSLKKEEKRAKLLQYALRIWGITSGTDDEKIDSAIEKTVHFFQSLGMKNTLADYGISKDVDLLVARLEQHGHTALGEQGNITLTISRQILERI